MKGKSKVLLTAFFVIIAVPSEAQRVTSSGESEAGERGGQREDAAQNSSDTTLTVRIVETDDQAKSRRASEEATRRREQNESNAQQRSITFDYVQFIFGILTFGGLIFTLYYARKSALAAVSSANAAIRAVTVAEGAADAASRSAIAAEEIVTITREQFAVANRPYVTVQPKFSLSRQTGDTGRIPTGFSVSAIANNIGLTPAEDMDVSYGIEIIPAGEASVDHELQPSDRTSILAPGGSFNTHPQAFPSQIFDGLFNGARLVFTIRVSYRNPSNGFECLTQQSFNLEVRIPWESFIRGSGEGVGFAPQSGGRMS